jgi:hypothetical protein
MNLFFRALFRSTSLERLTLPKINVEDKMRLDNFIDLLNRGERDFSEFQPLYKWIQYAIWSQDYVVHGSTNGNIETFTPRKQTLFNGKETTAVFASNNSVWSIFFAILNPRSRVGSIRNGCFIDDRKSKITSYYLFSIDSRCKDPFCDGWIYFLPKESFKQGGAKAEWICEEEVRPIASISVKPTDFPYLHSIKKHEANEPLWKTWLRRK